MSEGVLSAIENTTKTLQDVQAQLDGLPSLELIAFSARHEAIGEAMGNEGFDISIDEQADKVVYYINGHDDFRIMRERTKHLPFQLMKREKEVFFCANLFLRVGNRDGEKVQRNCWWKMIHFFSNQ